MESNVPFRIPACRPRVLFGAQQTNCEGSAGHHRVWIWPVSPSMTVLARRVHRATGEHHRAVFGLQRDGTLGSVGATWRLRPLFGAEEAVRGRLWAIWLGNVCPSGRNGPRPAYPNGCKGQGLARPSGATVSDHRALAGATVGAPSTLRPRETHRRAVLRAPRPIWTGMFVRTGRIAVSGAVRGVWDHR